MFEKLRGLNAKEWKYLAEGYDSILFSYEGPDNPLFNNMAMRLFKQPRDEERIEFFTPSARELHVRLHQAYIDKFISPVMKHVDQGKPYIVSEEFIHELSKINEEKRPLRRRKESFIQKKCTVVLLHTNKCPKGSFVVEVKPKWGFKPDCCIIPEDSIKRKVSRFQLLQRLKLARGEIKNISSYEPEDLLSQDPVRVERAIDSLIKEPQGNLKVFDDGKPVSLNSDLKGMLVNIFCTMEEFRQLLQLQKLDLWDIEGIMLLLERAGNMSWSDFLRNPSISEGIQKLLNGDMRIPTVKEELLDYVKTLDKTSCQIYVCGFLISQAAKDCSLMLTFKDRNNLENPSISAIDMDLKFPQQIEKRYYRHDKEIVENYLRVEGM